MIHLKIILLEYVYLEYLDAKANKSYFFQLKFISTRLPNSRDFNINDILNKVFLVQLLIIYYHFNNGHFKSENKWSMLVINLFFVVDNRPVC